MTVYACPSTRSLGGLTFWCDRPAYTHHDSVSPDSPRTNIGLRSGVHLRVFEDIEAVRKLIESAEVKA